MKIYVVVEIFSHPTQNPYVRRVLAFSEMSDAMKELNILIQNAEKYVTHDIFVSEVM